MKILKHKKGQGLSLNAVIIAVIVLIVLVVLVMVFTGQFAEFMRKLGLTREQTCAGVGGRICDNCPNEYIVEENSKLPENQQTCCSWSYVGSCEE